MNDFAKVDKDFDLKSKIDKEGIRFYSVDEPPFKIYGVFKEGGKYRRMPESVAKTVNYGVYVHHSATSGGRIRFVTDSPYVAVNVKLSRVALLPNFSIIGSSGLDMYVREDGKDCYAGTFAPDYDTKDHFERLVEFKNNKFAQPVKKLREITINMPTYTEVEDIYIGLDGSAILSAASDYVNEKPIVYYGHSITQGGCVSRPGFVYPNIISRRLHCDFINLGFSGSAKGEAEIADYIAGLDMKAFVYDYDHNAPDVEHLKNTHEKMFRIIREAQPELPVIMLTTTPKLVYLGSNEERADVVYTTYKNAVDSGDRNVYFVNGTEICDDFDGEAGVTMEGSHLSDIGFKNLADALTPIIEKIL